MKAFGLISLMITMCLVAYLMLGQKDASPNAPTPQNAQALEERARRAAQTANVEVVKGAVVQYIAAKETKPAGLEDLVEAGFLARVPGDVVYNAETGEVSARP